MPPLSPAGLRKQIAAGETAPLYVLVGADDIEKSAVATEFTEMVDEGLRAFNVDRVYGGARDVTSDDLFDASATLPMMAPRRIVIVHDAERLLIPKREGKAADEEQERLEAFVKNPPRHATDPQAGHVDLDALSIGACGGVRSIRAPAGPNPARS